MYKRGDNLNDYIGEIIREFSMFLIKIIFALLFIVISFSTIINNQSDITTTIFSISLIIVLFYLSFKSIKKVKNTIKKIKTTGKFNIYLKNIGQLILFITAFSIVPVIFIICYYNQKENDILKQIKQVYPMILLIGFALGIIINIIDSILSSHTKNKNILIRYDKYNK